MKRTQSGFTLVELLVVIAIIGILMGLAIPAVNSAREAARRGECATKMKNLALAGFQYEGSKGQLPGWIQSYGTFTGTSDPSDPGASAPDPHVKLGTWAVALLPWLDAQPTYEHWTEDRYPITSEGDGALPQADGNFHSLASPNLAIMQCPSNPATVDLFGKNSYVSNNGLVHSASPWNPVSSMGVGVNFSDSMSRANGAMNSKFAGFGVTSPNPVGQKVRMDDFKDGQGNTMLFSENVQARSWSRPGFLTKADIEDSPLTDLVLPYPVSSRYTSGMVWHYEDPSIGAGGTSGTAPTPSQQHLINGGGATISEDRFVLEMDSTNAADLARPSSAHVDGVNSAMADGATRFVRDSIDYRVYQALMTLRGKSSDVPWPEFIMTDELE